MLYIIIQICLLYAGESINNYLIIGITVALWHYRVTEAEILTNSPIYNEHFCTKESLIFLFFVGVSILNDSETTKSLT